MIDAVIDQICVVVPATDEAELLPDCLAALTVARAHAEGEGVRVRLLVVLDACTDNSAQVVAAAEGVESLRVAHGNVGLVREAGSRQLLRDCADAAATWLAHTDADSQVPEQWLVAMLGHARRGAHLVAGTVRPEPDLEPSVSDAWHRRHVLADGHPHVHGANLGIRADVYLTLGGWRGLPVGEDVDLVTRAAQLPGVLIVRTGAVPVRTSARRRSRISDGFAGYLRALPPDDELAG